MSNENILEAILSHEGGFALVQGDRGGATNFGITQATLAAWRGVAVTVEEVRTLRKDEAIRIYESEYILKPGFGKIAFEPLRHLLIDSGVQHGTSRATKWLQDAIGVKPDGVIGAKTLVVLAGTSSAKVFQKILQMRIAFYGLIISRDASQAKFAAGWMSRVSGFVGMA